MIAIGCEDKYGGCAKTIPFQLRNDVPDHAVDLPEHPPA